MGGARAPSRGASARPAVREPRPTRRIALTAGEPAGIGPDLLVQLAQRRRRDELVAIADGDVLADAAHALDLPLALRPYDPSPPPRACRAGELSLLHVPCAHRVRGGKLDPRNAAHVAAMLDRASAGALSGEFAAIVTAPVHKGVICDSGVPFTGHTEFFAERAAADVVMLLVAGTLRVALATTHLPIAAVPAAISEDLLERTLRILRTDLVARFGIKAPRIAVLGLNPHAGEGGHLGREEIDTIAPVVARLRRRGWRLDGPLAADTAFVPARREGYDAYLAMFHDQGLPVLKALGFGAAVNVTLGLPYVRTSVDHGVALDLARTGRAEVSSLEAALRLSMVMQ